MAVKPHRGYIRSLRIDCLLPDYTDSHKVHVAHAVEHSSNLLLSVGSVRKSSGFDAFYRKLVRLYDLFVFGYLTILLSRVRRLV
jgi:hypothetical protein